MKKRKRTEVTIQTREVVVLHAAGTERRRARCPVCGTVVVMISPEEAARVAGVSVRAIYRWVEAEFVHYVEGAGGNLRICAPSLRELK